MNQINENEITCLTEDLWNSFLKGGELKLKEKLSLHFYGSHKLINNISVDLSPQENLIQKTELLVNAIKHNGITGIYDLLSSWYCN